MVLVGLDPSFKRTGIAVLVDGKIIIDRCERKANSDKSFVQVWSDAIEQSEFIGQKLFELIGIDKEVQVLSECPPPQGMFSPGLYALDSLLFKQIRFMVKSCYVVYPNYLGHVHGTRKYSKSDSLRLAETIIRDLVGKVKIEIRSKRMSHDEAEALIFLMRLCVKNNMWKTELQNISGLFSENEKLLF